MRQHQLQFVISPAPLNVYPDWQFESVQGRGILSHCPKLPVRKVVSRGGSEYILIGLAVQTEASRPSPLEEIANSPAFDADLTSSWAGRWALVANGTLQTDALGMLGCLYTGADAGQPRVSSSAALLRTPQTPIFDDRILAHNVGVEWYVAPLTRFEGIRRLLPSQKLDLKTGRIIAKRLFRPVELTYEQALERVEDTLVTAIKALWKTSRSLWLPLTSGFDSRLLLAAVFRAGVKVRCYTQWYADMSRGDLTLPPKLARLAGFQHFLIKPGEYDRGTEAIFAAHTSEQSADRDKEFICRGQWDHFRESDIILRGGGIEIGCLRASRNHFSASPESPWKVPNVNQILTGCRQDATGPLVHALQEWRAWTEATEHTVIDWRDRFYIEQRLGAWASSIEQALDLSPCARVPLSSSERYISSVLQIPEHIRQDSSHQVELIRRMAPHLLAYPFNPKTPLIRRIPRAMRNRSRSLMQAIFPEQFGVAG
ncbi:MAG: hypothetical protein WAO35_15050 [Terriglobia bacterium]